MTNVDILEGIDTFPFVKNTVLSVQFIREKIERAPIHPNSTKNKS